MKLFVTKDYPTKEKVVAAYLFSVQYCIGHDSQVSSIPPVNYKTCLFATTVFISVTNINILV